MSSDPLAQVLEDATAYYSDRLAASDSDGRRARAAFADRGVRPSAMIEYQLGYAPAGWSSLSRHLRALGHPEDRLVEAGLASRTRAGRLVDRFRGRLMFPVYDGAGGEVLGFLGRLLPSAASGALGASASAVPKYLNSPATAKYRKAEVLYALGAAPTRAALTAGATPVLVEGPLDAIAISTASSSHVGLAPCGTALTRAQLAGLATHVGPDRPLLVAFDNDAAGRSAAVRAFPLLRELGAWPQRVDLPAGSDPAEFAQRHGIDALAQALESCQPLMDLVVDEHLAQWSSQLAWAEGRVGALRSCAGSLALAPPEHLARQVQRLADRLALPYTDVTGAVLEVITEVRHPMGSASGGPRPHGTTPSEGPRPSRLSPASYPSTPPLPSCRPEEAAPGDPARAGPPTGPSTTPDIRRARTAIAPSTAWPPGGPAAQGLEARSY